MRQLVDDVIYKARVAIRSLLFGIFKFAYKALHPALQVCAGSRFFVVYIRLKKP